MLCIIQRLTLFSLTAILQSSFVHILHRLVVSCCNQLCKLGLSQPWKSSRIRALLLRFFRALLNGLASSQLLKHPPLSVFVLWSSALKNLEAGPPGTRNSIEKLQEHSLDLPSLSTLRRPLDYLLAAWNSDCQLSGHGEYLLRRNYRDSLSTQMLVSLELEKLASDARFQRLSVDSPIFLVGFPRTGSTFLHKVLSHDAQLRCPKLWELLVPAPTKIDNLTSLVEEVETAVTEYFVLQPEMQLAHDMSVMEADECCHIFEQIFIDRHAPVVCRSTRVREYQEWLYSEYTEEEALSCYSYYKQALKLILYRALLQDPTCTTAAVSASPSSSSSSPSEHLCTGQRLPDHSPILCLKDATHLFFLEALLKTFPSARFVFLHRSLSSVFASNCSGFNLVSNYYYQPARSQEQARKNALDIGQRVLRSLTAAAQNLVHFREHYKDDLERNAKEGRGRCYDLYYDDFVADPKSQVLKMYEHFGLDSSNASFMSYLTALPKKPYDSPHKYSFDDYGISTSELQNAFSSYIQHFHVHV